MACEAQLRVRTVPDQELWQLLINILEVRLMTRGAFHRSVNHSYRGIRRLRWILLQQK
jgi:hypothetical protein